MITFGFSFVFPFLLVVVSLQVLKGLFFGRLSGWATTLILCALAAVITIVPVGGLSLGRWLISFNANFSIPLTALLFSRVLKNACGIRLLDGNALLTCWIYSIITGAILYPMALGLGRFDPYEAGWDFSWFFAVVFLTTVALLFMKNRFAVVLIVSVLAYNLHLLESTNLWDYLIDPFLVIVSGIALVAHFLRYVSRNGQAQGDSVSGPQGLRPGGNVDEVRTSQPEVPHEQVKNR